MNGTLSQSTRAPKRDSAVAIHPDEFRRTCSQFPTGVTVITAVDTSGSVSAMTLSAFMSISLEPLLVLISVSNRARMRKVLDQASELSVSILAHGQQAVSSYLAGLLPPDTPKPFTFSDHLGIPVVDDAVAHLVARIVNRIDAGDHRLYLAEPVRLHTSRGNDGRPLVYCQGSYMGLYDEAPPAIDWVTEYATVTGLV